ncbi:MAG TPA: ABC transporter permease [Candidatus Acidoferrum sp.]|nr:ABC transporter permease [Candidatus Acidoferrum sp.]
MSLLRNISSGMRSLFRKEQVDRELDEELGGFLEMAAEEKMKQGINRAEAVRAVRLERGNLAVTKEVVYAARWEAFLETCWQDVRFGVRMLRKNPGFTAVVVLTLALGIGANTAIFSLLNAVMLQRIPVRNPQELVVLRWSAHSRPKSIGHSSFGDCKSTEWAVSAASSCSLSYPILREIRKQSREFSGIAAFAGPAQLDLSGNGMASVVSGELVSGDFFQTLGVPAASGRTIDSADEKPGAEAVAVLSYAYWRTAFGGSPSAVGKTVTLNGAPFTIVGVADSGFTRLSPGKSQDLWVPLSQTAALRLPWGGGTTASEKTNSFWLTVVGRLAPGVSLVQAQTATSLVFRDQVVQDALLKPGDDPQVTLLPAQTGLVGMRSWVAEPLFLVMAAVAILLLISCANVAGLMLSRAAARRKEIAVRLSLGASRGRITRQLLTESLLLAFAGAAVGILIAFWGANALASFVTANRYSALYLNATPDLTVLLFSAGIAVLTGILFGLAPALAGTSANIAPALKESSIGTSKLDVRGGRKFALGSGLVVAQVALSVLVLAGAGLVIRSLANLKKVNPGFDTTNVLQFGVDPERSGHYNEERTRALYRELQNRLSYLPGVVAVSYSSDTLLNGGLWTSDVQIEGRADKSLVEVEMLTIGPDYFKAMRIPVVAGRVLSPVDMASAPDVAVVNRVFVRRFLENREPLGLHFGGSDPKDAKYEIVGVVEDTKYDDLRRDPEPIAFLPQKKGQAYFAVRTSANPLAVVPLARTELRNLDSNLPIFDVRTQTERIDRMLFGERLIARLAGLFGVVALILACIGLYGLLSYEVARQTKEIGVRTALGAQKGDLLRLIARQGLTLVATGIALGIVGFLGVTRFLKSLLYGVQPTDTQTLLGVGMLLLIVGGLACLIPARRAMRVDPMVALRYE